MPERAWEPTLESDHLLELRLRRQSHVLGDSLALVENHHHRYTTHAVLSRRAWGLVNIDFAHKESDIRLGDQITLKVEGRETTWQVVGVCTTQMVGAGEPVPEQPMAYVDYSHFAEVIREDGMANRAAVAIPPAPAPITRAVRVLIVCSIQIYGVKVC